MALFASVQFKNKEDVLEAYQDRKVLTWACLHGKELQNKGDTIEALESWLNILEKSGSNATYTLRVYEEIEDLRKIKHNTPSDGGFNFKLNEEKQQQDREYYNGRRETFYDKLDARLGAIEEKLNAPPDDEDDEEEEDVTIGAVMKNPKLLDPYFDAFERIMGITNRFQQRELPAAMGNVFPPPQQTIQQEQMTTQTHASQSQPAATDREFTEEEYKKLGSALYRIYQKEPDIVNIIEKIANRIESGEEMKLGKLVEISASKLKALSAFI